MSKKNRPANPSVPATNTPASEVPNEPIAKELSGEFASEESELNSELTETDDEADEALVGDLSAIDELPDNATAVVVDIAGRVAYMLAGDTKNIPDRDVAIEVLSKAIPVVISATRLKVPEANLFQAEIKELLEKDAASFCGDLSRLIRSAAPKKVSRAQSVELARQLVNYFQSMPLEQTEALYSVFPSEPAAEE